MKLIKINPAIFAKMSKPLARALGVTGLWLKKHGPEILTAIGVGTSIAGTVTACAATTRLEPILDEHKENVNKVKSLNLDEKAEKKELAKVYAGTGKKLVKLYALSAALEGVSTACQIGSTHMLRKDNKALTAAYMGLLEAYRAQHKELPKIEAEEGSDGVKKEPDDVDMTNRLSPYACVFDKQCSNWRRRASDNETFLVSQMNTANDILHARGHIFLNEVYDLLGMNRTEAGQFVGWVDGMGDSFIDFNMICCEDPDGDNLFWLDFNVDGSIMYIFDQMFGGDGKDKVFMVSNN